MQGLKRAFIVFHEPWRLGAGTSVLQVIPRLKELGWSIACWVPGPGPLADSLLSLQLPVFGRERPLAFSRRSLAAAGPLDCARRLPDYARDLRRALIDCSPHVVLGNSVLALPEAAYAKRMGLPVAMQVHEIPNPSAKRGLALWLASHTADVFVAVSDAVAEMLRPSVRQRPLYVVRNGVPDLFRPSQRDGQRFVVGTVGATSRVKATDVFVEAARIVGSGDPAVFFEHIGPQGLSSDTGFEGTVLELAAGIPNLTFLGYADARSALRRWDLFVLPSRSEGFPLATLEAMAAGVPVIASRVGGIPEQIRDGIEGVLIEPDDPGALAAAITRLYTDPTARSAYSAAALDRVRSLFTLDKQAAGIEAALVAAISAAHGPGELRTSRGSAYAP